VEDLTPTVVRIITKTAMFLDLGAMQARIIAVNAADITSCKEAVLLVGLKSGVTAPAM